MKRALYSLLFILLINSVYAQSYYDEFWWKGHVVLNDGTKQEGLINYDYRSNTLILKTGQYEKTYSAGDIYSFKFNEVRREGRLIYALRRYYTIYEKNKRGMLEPKFYNVLVGGDVSVMVRSKYDYIDYFSPKDWFYNGDVSYLRFSDGRVERASGWRKKVISQLGGNPEELRAYIKEHKLNLWYPYDLARLVHHFNISRDS